MMKSRSISVFEEYIQSDKTREQYLFHLRKFTEHYKLESIDGILPHLYLLMLHEFRSIIVGLM